MSGQRTHGQLVEIIATPTKVTDTGTQCHGTVHTATRNHNIRTLLQGQSHGKGPQVSIDTGDFLHRGKGLSTKHLNVLLFRQLCPLTDKIVANNTGYLQIQTLLGNHRAQRIGAGLRVNPASIGDDFDPLTGDLFKIGFHCRADKV